MSIATGATYEIDGGRQLVEGRSGRGGDFYLRSFIFPSIWFRNKA